MAHAESKVTAQGQVSVPAEIRRKLGLAPGSVLEWHARGGQVVVRKAGRHSSLDVHRALFGEEAPRAGVDVKEAICAHIRRRHARD